MLSIAHRGASGHAPENTISAFKKALALKADMIELDVRRCKSGELVVFHDALLNRVTNGKGKVRQKTLSELKELTVLDTEKISTLEEVLDFLDRRVLVDINVKDTLVISQTADVIHTYITAHQWKKENILLSATNYLRLYRAKKRYPVISIAPMVFFWPAFMAMVCALLKPAALKFPKRMITVDIMKFAKYWKIPVYIWTVNKKEEIGQLERMGVDGVITNYPELIK